MKTIWRVQKTRFVPKPGYANYGKDRHVYQCRRTQGNRVFADYLVCANDRDEAEAAAIDRYVREEPK